MTNLLWNLNNFDSLYTLSLEKFLIVRTFLTFILSNSAVEFLLLYSFTVVSLVATLFRNLIYKVLNIGLLSIFIVALWALSTDLTFIYVAYVLAFIGAVIMLFLSIVLMLPASVVTTIARLNIASLQSTQNELSFLDYWSFTSWLCISLFLSLLFFFMIKKVKFSNRVSFSRNFRIKRFKNKIVHVTRIDAMRTWLFHFMGGLRRVLRPCSVMFVLRVVKIRYKMYQRFFSDRATYIRLVLTNSMKLAYHKPAFGAPLKLVRYKLTSKNPKCFFKNGMIWKLCEVVQNIIITLVRFFFDRRVEFVYLHYIYRYYFIAVPTNDFSEFGLEGFTYDNFAIFRFHYLFSGKNAEIYKRLKSNDKTVVKAGRVDLYNNHVVILKFWNLENFLFTRLFTLYLHLNGDYERFIIDYLKNRNKDFKRRAKIINYFESKYLAGDLKVPCSFSFWTVLMKLFYSKHCKFCNSLLVLIYYLTSAFNVLYVGIRLFIMEFVSRAKLSYTTIGLVVQLAVNSLLFFIAVPFTSSKGGASPEIQLLPVNGIPEAENLAAVQQILYISNPTFLFVTVVTLLVALIGAAVMHYKQKNKKN